MRRPVVTRARTYLRRPDRVDGQEFVERVLASRKHLEPFIFAADSMTAYRAWTARSRRDDVEQFLVCRRDDDAVAGFVNLNVLVGSLQSAAMGWAGFLPHVGHGYLTDGVDMAMEFAFVRLRLHRVEANIQPPNDRSRRLAIRVGLRLEGFSPAYLRVGGEWRDHERWAILGDEWRARTHR